MEQFHGFKKSKSPKILAQLQVAEYPDDTVIK